MFTVMHVTIPTNTRERDLSGREVRKTKLYATVVRTHLGHSNRRELRINVGRAIERLPCDIRETQFAITIGSL